MRKIGKYARKENKLMKVCADDVKVLKVLEKALGGVKVEFGIVEGDCPRE